MTIYVVAANDLDGITEAAGNSHVVFVNEGVLVSNASHGISLDESFQSVTVQGHVVSTTATGIRLGGGASINGFNILTIGSSGSVQGVGLGLSMDDGNNRLINNGGIFGAGFGTNGANIGGASNYVLNNGVIGSTQNGLGFTGGVFGTNTLENFGLISGQDNAIFGSSTTSEVITNRGNISGDITLFGGADRIDNEGGIITGRINMGDDSDTLLGGASTERALGGAGADTMDFGAGNDTYLAGNPEGEGAPDGNDDLDGGDGIDTYDASDTTGAATVSLLEHRAVGTSINNDFVFNFENVVGGAGADNITGGADRDILQGGAGADRFDFNAVSESAAGSATRDIILDFELGIDDIDVSTIDANGVGAGNTAFTFIGAGAFTSTAGELRLTVSVGPGFSVVQGDTDGDGKADIEIQIRGALALAAGDFIL